MKIICIILTVAVFTMANTFLAMLALDETKKYKEYKEIINSNQTSISKGITLETAKSKLNICIKNISLNIFGVITITIITLATIYGVSLDFKAKETDKLSINNKISEGYEVYLDYGDGREQTKLNNYIYKTNDTVVFNVREDEENRKIILELNYDGRQ